MAFLSETELEDLYVRLEKPVYNVVFRWVWEREEAHDIVQEAFVRLWKMRRRVECETAQALVYKIALNLAASRLRWRKIRTLLPVDALRTYVAPGRDVEATTIEEEKALQLRSAVLDLPQDLRRVVLLTEYSDLSYEEIGELLGVAAGTIASRRHRAVARLRQALAPEEQRGSDNETTQNGAHPA